MPKQLYTNAGIYLRLSREDAREGESLSIENQRLILTEHVKKQGWNIGDIYVDDGVSGTTLDRPAMNKLVEDCRSGKINIIVVKDMSRLGRDYIGVGNLIEEMVSRNVRIVAVNDGIDTADMDSSQMQMLPFVNIFNEWHARSTSEKIKAVKKACARDGKYSANFAPFGYIKGDDPKHLPVVDPEAAAIVKRMFTMRSEGISPRHIADTLNNEKIPTASDYCYARLGKPNPRDTKHLWSAEVVRQILNNPTYLGDLVQMRTETVSHKIHKSVKNDKEDWIVVPNTHEAIISRELWDKCREMEASVSQGRKTKSGFVDPLSGLMYCADCGEKMRIKFRLLSGRCGYENGVCTSMTAFIPRSS